MYLKNPCMPTYSVSSFVKIVHVWSFSNAQQNLTFQIYHINANIGLIKY